MSNTYVKQEGGAHYQGAAKQHWDLVEEHGVSYLAACASKYPLRWRDKGGISDLRKALTYVEKMLKCRLGEERDGRVPTHELTALFDGMKTPKRERDIVSILLGGVGRDDLLTVQMKLKQLIAENE